MRIYSVHLRRLGLDPDRDVVLVKEGFCWPAFLFSIFWALWCRMWLVAVGLLVAELALSGIIAVLGLDPLSEVALTAGLALIVGFIANDLRRWTLKRQDFVESAVVAAPDREHAERRFFDANPELASGLAR